MIGQTISHYEIQSKLGEGGMGVVYKAHDTELDRTVALKFLSPQALDRESDKSRFVREAKAAASLHHPNICTIHEIDEHEGQLFIAMAYAEGRTLRDTIGGGPVKIEDAIDIVKQVGSGLRAAHDKGIVHRDVKPGNVMLDASGRALLLDFGLAQRADTTRVTKTGTTVGTVAYMSPEQLGGEDVDARTDVWSLGVMLHELVTGRLPFKGDLEPALMFAIAHSDPESVTPHRPDAPAGLDGIIARALDKRPGDRYPDAASMLADLDELLGDPESFPAGVPLSKRRRRRKRLALGAFAALFVAAVAMPFVLPKITAEAQTIATLAVLPVANLSGDTLQDVFAAGIHAELISTLGKIDNLVVRGRRSVLKYKDSDQAAEEIADELGVQALMEGSISIVGDDIHIAAELVDASSGEVLWTDTFDGTLNEALDLQRRIALAVADGIHAQLTPGLEQEEPRAVDPDAYRLYLKFQADWSSKNALPTLKQAVAIDSTFAEAWAALSARASYSAHYGHIPRDEGYELARTAAEKAIAVDAALAVGHLAMATIQWDQDWNWDHSLREIERAAELNPTEADVRNSIAARLFMTGRIDEGIALYEKAIALDPLNPSLRQRLGWHLGNVGRTQLAKEHYLKNLELFPNDRFSNMLLALAHTSLGEYEEAVAQRKKMEQMYEHMRFDADGDSIPEKGIGPRYTRGGGTGGLVKAYANTDARVELVEAMEEAKTNYEVEPSATNAWLVAFYLIPLGEKDEARDWLAISAEAALQNVRDGTPRAAREVFNQAYLYSSLGDKDEAFEWLELAMELRAAGLADLYRRTYRFVELWDDPRYEELMRRRGFPEEVIVSLRQ